MDTLPDLYSFVVPIDISPMVISVFFDIWKTADRNERILRDEDTASASGTTFPFHTCIRCIAISRTARDRIQRRSDSFRAPCSHGLVPVMHRKGIIITVEITANIISRVNK